jgi:hypothetical protein
MRLSRGATTFGNFYRDQLLDQVCDALNRMALAKDAESKAAPVVGISIVNSSVTVFTPGALGGYDASGNLVLATAAGTTPILARFVSLNNAAPAKEMSIVTSGLVPVQTDLPPLKRGDPAWLSQSSPGKATRTRPTTGSRQMLGVFDTKDAKTGLWNIMLLLDSQMVRVLG